MNAMGETCAGCGLEAIFEESERVEDRTEPIKPKL